MTIQLVSVNILTDPSGDFSSRTPKVSGRFVQWRYVPDDSDPLATGGDLDIVGAQTGVELVDVDSIGTSAITRAPRQATHDVDGTASLYADAGEPVEGYIFVNEPLTVTVANGGDTLAGTLFLWIA